MQASVGRRAGLDPPSHIAVSGSPPPSGPRRNTSRAATFPRSPASPILHRMTAPLTPHHRRLAEALVASGRYADEADVLRAPLRLLEAEEQA